MKTAMDSSYVVAHNPAQSRFEVALGDDTAVCDYRRIGRLMVLPHTWVPPAQEGRGMAAAMVAATLSHARALGLKVRPSCSYAAAYMRRHPDTLDLLESGSTAS